MLSFNAIWPKFAMFHGADGKQTIQMKTRNANEHAGDEVF
jgi:hypothetical protein